MTATPETWPVPVAGAWIDTPTVLEVRNPYDGSPVARTVLGGPADFDRAAEAVGALPAFERAAILRLPSHSNTPS